MNGNTSLSNIKVHRADLILRVDLDLESARSRLYAQLLIKHGTNKTAGQFQYNRYQALSPQDRCFDNAMGTALRYDLRYMEGLMILTCDSEFGGQERHPLAHGWCEDRQGNIVDPTCHKYQDHPSVRYIGLAIQKRYSENWKTRVGYYGCLDGDKDGYHIGVHFESPALWLDTVQYHFAEEIKCN